MSCTDFVNPASTNPLDVPHSDLNGTQRRTQPQTNRGFFLTVGTLKSATDPKRFYRSLQKERFDQTSKTKDSI